MNALGEFIMRSRVSAMFFIAGSSLLPLVGLLGSAALALVVLRRGATEGGIVMGGALFALAALSFVFTGNPGGAVMALVLVWLPVFIVASVLRETFSLSLALTVGVALAALGLLVWHVLVPDPEAVWRARYSALGGGMGEAEIDQIMSSVGRYLAAFMALSLWVNAVIGLLLGRALQARLYNPGGFRLEFHGLKLDWRLAGGSLVVLVLAMVSGQGLVYDVSLLLCGLFAMQALAVSHAVVHGRGLHGALLILPYVLLPVAFVAVALLGILDAWLDIRRRLLETPVGGDN